MTRALRRPAPITAVLPRGGAVYRARQAVSKRTAPIIGYVWVELLLALIVEGYREFTEWWQSRAFLRPRRRAADDESDTASLVAGEPVVAPAAARFVADTVDAILGRHARKHVGVALGVWWQGETWTFARGRIDADQLGSPVPDTIFEIGSVTKVFTATVLADMVEEGLVALDDPVQRYLPAGVELPVRGRPITLADLASQTSGLPRLPPGLLRRSVLQRRNPYAGFTEFDLERAISRTRLKSSPGETLRYSNFGFGLLGYALARCAEQPFEQLVRERVCDPLALADTQISIAAEACARFADGHDRRGRQVPHWELAALAGAGALRSTVADLLCFLELQLQQPRTRLGRAAQATHESRAHRGRLSQSLGWAGLPLRGDSRQMLWHNGGTGGFRSFLGFVRESEAGVAVLSNCSRSVDAIGFRILEALSRG
jgi:D-alanyl-D-alanine-carboxypeptidase/D-alanyl-D-alanine-endopeptidase